MSTNTTESVALTACLDMFAKVSRGKDSIVRMDMFDQDIIFEGFFGLKHLLSGSSFLEMSIEKLAAMIHPDSAIFVLVIGNLTSLKRNVPANAGNHLINGNHVIE